MSPRSSRPKDRRPGGGAPQAPKPSASAPPSEEGPMRLQRRLAQLGVASRRASERLITAGRVRVNGRVVTELGTRVTPRDAIAVDGRPVEALDPIVGVLHKPPGVLCAASDDRGRDTIYDLLPPDLPFLAHVGRLDYQTAGVLLLTNDGALARRLLHPDTRVPRVYEVKIRGHLGPAALARLEAGIELDGRPTLPVVVERVRSRSRHDWLRLTLFEGRNRHVRRILEAVGTSVTRLIRTSFGNITLEGLPPGGFRLLDAGEESTLRGFRP